MGHSAEAPGSVMQLFYTSGIKPGRVGLVARWRTCPWRRAAGQQGQEGRPHPTAGNTGTVTRPVLFEGNVGIVSRILLAPPPHPPLLLAFSSPDCLELSLTCGQLWALVFTGWVGPLVMGRLTLFWKCWFGPISALGSTMPLWSLPFNQQTRGQQDG